MRSPRLVQQIIFLSILVVLTGVMACQRKLTPQPSCSFLQNPDVQRVSWKSPDPVALYVDQSVPSSAYGPLNTAIQIYAEAFHRPVFKIKGYGITGHPAPKRDGFSVIYWMSDWESDRLKEQGRTTVYWGGNTIYEADMRINASSLSHLVFNFAADSLPASGSVDLKSLFIHELGHVLGLDHSQMPGSIMYPYLQEGVERDTLSSQDLSNLECEYGHS